MSAIHKLEEEVVMLRGAWDQLNREMENDTRVQTARKGHLDAVAYARTLREKLDIRSVRVHRQEHSWLIETKDSLDVVRHSPHCASAPELTHYERLVHHLCSAIADAQMR